MRAYLDSPKFDADSIDPVAGAFAVTPAVLPAGAKDDLFGTVARELTGRVNKASFQADLEVVLNGFGPTLAHDSTDLFENLLRDLRVRVPEFGKNANAALSGQLNGGGASAYDSPFSGVNSVTLPS